MNDYNPNNLAKEIDDEASSTKGSALANRHTVSRTPCTGSTVASTPQEEYHHWRAEQGSATTFDNDKRAVHRYVRETLFSKLKFITRDSELDYTGEFLTNGKCNCKQKMTQRFHILQQVILRILFAKQYTSRSTGGTCLRRLSEIV